MTAAAPAPRDPGLQAERTALAWSRTGLAMAVNALLVLRSGFVSDQASLVVAGVLLFGLSAGAAAYGTVRRRELASSDGPSEPSAWVILGLAATVVLATCAALVSILLEVAR